MTPGSPSSRPRFPQKGVGVSGWGGGREGKGGRGGRRGAKMFCVGVEVVVEVGDGVEVRLGWGGVSGWVGWGDMVL